jgi:hypothetical protein
MIVETGNIWSAYNDAHIMAIPSCSTTEDGRLVMARGLARQVNEAHPGIDFVFGAMIDMLYGSEGYFDFLYMPQIVPEEYKKYALIQTKRRYMNEIDTAMVTRGLWSIEAIANYNPEKEIHTVFFKWVDMDYLPDNVYAWKRK